MRCCPLLLLLLSIAVVQCLCAVCYLFMVNLHTQPRPMLLLITFLYLFYPKFIGRRAENLKRKYCKDDNGHDERTARTTKNTIHTKWFTSKMKHLSLAFTIVSAHNEVWEIYGRWYYRPQKPAHHEHWWRRRRGSTAQRQAEKTIWCVCFFSFLLIFWLVRLRDRFFISLFLWAHFKCAVGRL